MIVNLWVLFECQIFSIIQSEKFIPTYLPLKSLYMARRFENVIETKKTKSHLNPSKNSNSEILIENRGSVTDHKQYYPNREIYQ